MSHVLVFDSGLGGLTIVQAIREISPSLSLVYAADNEGFPYGAWPREALRQRIVGLMGPLLEATQPRAVVLACNTASTIALDALRRTYSAIPFIGTVPAIKPAVQRTKSNMIGVLSTLGTTKSGYLETLITQHGQGCQIILHGCPSLANLTEAYLGQKTVSLEAVYEEIAPVFRLNEQGQKTDVVVLGCTHYPFLLPILKQVAPWEVMWIDPADAIARRLQEVLEISGAFASISLHSPQQKTTGEFEKTVLLTKCSDLTREDQATYERLGFSRFLDCVRPVETSF